MKLELQLRLQDRLYGAIEPDDEDPLLDGDPLHGAGIPAYLVNSPLPRYIEQWPQDSPARSLLRDFRERREV